MDPPEKALERAWYRRRLTEGQELMFHSDRGSQYASDVFRRMLNGFDIVASMSRREAREQHQNALNPELPESGSVRTKLAQD